MTLHDQIKLTHAKENIQEFKHFLDDLVDEYEKKTKAYAKIISKTESDRIEELKSEIKDLKAEICNLNLKLTYGAAQEEMDDIMDAIYTHISDKKNRGEPYNHEIKWEVVCTPLGYSRLLKCSCGECLFDGSDI